ncbi:MAG: hypothetical protein K2I91_01570, partial [Muribaculaceae bacterium]|nr:hypothetical protein [Muribaculaceae bacterium]
VTDLNLTRNDEGNLLITYTIDRNGYRLPGNAEILLTPVLHFEGDSIELSPTLIAGRSSYIAHRHNRNVPRGTELIRAKGEPVTRTAEVNWNEAMMRSELTFRAATINCSCRCTDTGALPERLAVDFSPREYELIIPRNQLAALEQDINQIVKTRAVTKSAHVNYKVGSTVLLPDFDDNPVELAAILATIDSICCDKDVQVNQVDIHGYASPEGSYALNTRLAKGRTEALRAYVDSHFNFGSTLTTSSTPEDWVGLRDWLVNSTLLQKDEILGIVDSNLSPDEKDRALQSRFPNAYKILLWDVYPTLRRSDYTIEYTVRNFTSPETIARLLDTAPDKLSLEEVMLLARTYQPGSAEHDDLALRAAELFPDDKRAQLNGAFVALERKNLPLASKLLSRSGNSPLADYGRGVLAIYDKDYTKALPLLEKAKAAKIEGADRALGFVQEMIK